MTNSVHERIKNRRKELKMSQTELANKVGLKPPAISQYESGVRKPSFEALRKLSFALKVSTEYLVSGLTQTQNQDQLANSDRVFLKIIHSLNAHDKEKLLEYAAFLATGRKIKVDLLFDSASDYADHLLKEKADGTLPIDLYSLAKEAGIKVLEDDLEEGEGLLIQGDHPIILLDQNIPFQARKKFTLATLIGHFLIPWHLKPNYISRKYRSKNEQEGITMGTSSLLTDEVEEMEAHKFASNLLIPSEELLKDPINQRATIEELKTIADTKYQVSLFSLLNRLVDFADDKYAVVQSQHSKIIKVYQGKRMLKSFDVEVDPRSKAAMFFCQPSEQEEVREGEVPANCWLLDAKENEIVYEQSIYNPKVGKVLTFLTLES
ncbi:helix-turn-helix domain-containing protein [Neobacillus dielmonensis]|uniref:helix-turn-helix domain-containing protein n=1 Tax=Neobacillus dielmonensis TaxID=1347369 RepID=UPI0006937D76|nr:XRE family transcriptional regulator [Neobacillus dielmonensis]